MIINHQKKPLKKYVLLAAYVSCTLTASTLAYAIVGNQSNAISEQRLQTLVQQKNINVTITPEVLAEMNRLLSNPNAKTTLKTALHNMQRYKPYIAQQLQKNGMPEELLALPFIESGYQPLTEAQNPMKAAGIWQFIPETAKQYGLTINKKRDDRLDTVLETQAAISYLQKLYDQFHDWKLAVIAYEIGEKNTDQLVKATGAQDAWELIRLAKDIHIINTKALEQYFAHYEAINIILKEPSLIA